MKNYNKTLMSLLLFAMLITVTACGGGDGANSAVGDTRATGRVLSVGAYTQTINPGFPIVVHIDAEAGIDGNDMSVGFYLINEDKGFDENGEYVEQFFLGTKVLPIGDTGGTFQVSFIAPENATAGNYSILTFTDPDVSIEVSDAERRLVSTKETVEVEVEENPDLIVEMVGVGKNVVVASLTGEVEGRTHYSATIQVTSYGHDVLNAPLTACVELPSGSCLPVDIWDSKSNIFTKILYLENIRKNVPVSMNFEAKLSKETIDQILSEYSLGEIADLSVKISINENSSIQEADEPVAATLKQIAKVRASIEKNIYLDDSYANNVIISNINFYSNETVAVEQINDRRLFGGGYYTDWLHYADNQDFLHDDFGGKFWMEFKLRGHLTPEKAGDRYYWRTTSAAEVRLTTELNLFGLNLRLFDGSAYAMRSDELLSAEGTTEPIEFLYHQPPGFSEPLRDSFDDMGYSVHFAGVELINVNKFLRPTDEYSLEITKYSYEKEYSKEKRYWAKICFLTLKGGLKGEVGIELRYDFDPEAELGDAQLRHALVAEPFLDTKAFGEVGVDIVILSFGAGIELTLFRIGFPISGSFDTGLINNKFTVVAQLSTDMEIRVFDGRVYLYLTYWNIPICCKWGFVYYPCGWPFEDRSEVNVVTWYGFGYEENFSRNIEYLQADIPSE